MRKPSQRGFRTESWLFWDTDSKVTLEAWRGGGVSRMAVRRGASAVPSAVEIGRKMCRR